MAGRASRRDLAVATVLVLLGVAVIGLALRVEPGVQTDALGPRAFPLALGAAITACGLLLGAAAALGDRWTASAAVFVESGRPSTSCVEYGERRRVPVVIENMNPLPGDSEFQYLGVTVEEFRALFDRIRSPYLGLALDVAHAELLPGGTAAFVRAFGERVHSAQLSDNRGRVDEHLTIGAGTIDFRRVLRALGRARFTGPLIIELFDVGKKLVSHRRLLRLLAQDGRGKGESPRPARGRPRVATP